MKVIRAFQDDSVQNLFISVKDSTSTMNLYSKCKLIVPNAVGVAPHVSSATGLLVSWDSMMLRSMLIGFKGEFSVR